MDRYAEAAADYQGEVNLMLRASIDEQKAFVERTYGKEAEELDVGERDRRTTAIERFERFVQRYPDNETYTPDAMFRLAELYYERSAVVFQDAEDQYDKDRDLYERGKIPAEPAPPRRDYSDTARTYRTLLARWGDSYRYADAVYYLLGYVLEESYEDEAAKLAWDTLVTKFPKSEYAPEVYLRIGEMHFDFAEYEEAAGYYRKAMAYQESRFYDKALYKLGWTFFQNFDYDSAINAFKQLIAWYDSDTERANSATASALREEAIEYLALSLTEDDWDNDGLDDPDAGVDRALGYLAGGTKAEREIIKGYANGLFELADRKKWGEAIRVYDHLIQTDPMDPFGPDYHERIIQILDELGEIDRAANERKRMAKLFGPGTVWWEKNDGDERARARMAKRMEEAMRKRALYHHERAQLLKVQAAQDQDPVLFDRALEQYQKAAVAYNDYLTAYPNEPTTYEMTFFLAEALWYSGSFMQSAPVYEKVARNKDNTTYREQAAWSAIKAYEKGIARLADEGAITANLVPGSDWTPEESEDESTDLRKVTPKPTPEMLRQWVGSVDYFIEQDMRVDGSRVPQATIAYQVADIFYRLDNFDEARRRFRQVISCYPDNDVAANAVANIINMYREENDWGSLEKWADIAQRLELGDEETNNEIRGAIKQFKLGSMFKRAESLYEQKRYLEAAREFERLADGNPDAAFADKAYYNAADAYKREKYYDSAARIFEKLVTDSRYSSSQFAEESLFQLAETNKLFFNFDKATNAYLTLYEKYPNGANRKYALFQSAKLQEAAGNFREAAKTYEKYSDAYSGEKEAAGAVYRAGELYEKLEDTTEQRRIWKRFVAEHESTVGMDVLVVEALSKLADLAATGGDKKSAEKYYKQILREYISRNQQPASAAAGAAAKSEFMMIQPAMDTYKKLRVTTTNQKRATAAIQKKTAQLLDLKNRYTDLAKYKSFDWLVAAVYQIAELYKDFAQTIYDVPEPEGLTEDEYDVYITQIEDLGLKYENVAIEFYEKAVKESRKYKVTSDWADKALEAIHKFKPQEYPLYKPEKRRTEFDPNYTIDTRVPKAR